MYCYSQEDYNRMVWGLWWKLTGTGPVKSEPECSHYKGTDLGGLGLCDHKGNLGSVPQEKGCLRCNIKCCPDGNKIEKGVKAILLKRETEREKEMLIQLKKEEADKALEKLNAPVPEVIDFLAHTSKDSLQYS